MTQMETIQAALGQAFWLSMDLQEVVQVAHDSTTPEEFAAKVDRFTDYTQEPFEGEIVIELPV